MNLALSILSAASATAEAEGVIDRLQSYTGSEEMTIAQQQLADPDYWSSVGIITITGLLVVFLILGLLIFIFWAMGQFFKNLDNKKNAKKNEAKAEKAPDKKQERVVSAAAKKEAAPSAKQNYGIDEETVAVISAAIAAYSAKDGKSYQIKSIKPKDFRARSAWSNAGIGENTRPF